MPVDPGYEMLADIAARRTARLGQLTTQAGQLFGVTPGEREIREKERLRISEETRPLDPTEQEEFRGLARNLHGLGAFRKDVDLPTLDRELTPRATRGSLDALRNLYGTLSETRLKERAVRDKTERPFDEIIIQHEAHALKKANELAIDPTTGRQRPINPTAVTVSAAKLLAASFPARVPATAKALVNLKRAYDHGGDAEVIREAKRQKAVSATFGQHDDPYLDRLLDAVIAGAEVPADTRTWWDKLPPNAVPAPAAPPQPRF